MTHAGFRALVAMIIIGIATVALPGEAATPKPTVSKEGQACIACHEQQSPAFVKEWRISKHASKGVDCYTCHEAANGDVDAMAHYGYSVAILVTPKDCGRCHAQQVKEMTSSHHAKAGDILNSLDNYLARRGLGGSRSGGGRLHAMSRFEGEGSRRRQA